LGVVSAGSLGTLVVVASLKSADILSTVALSLAILAFSAQLVIAISQGIAATQQLAETLRVNADTKAMLAEVRATNEQLLDTLGGQFDMVLKSALGQAIPQAVEEAAVGEEGGDDKRLEDRLTASLNDALNRYFVNTNPREPRSLIGRTSNVRSEGSAPIRTSNVRPEDAALIDRMRTIPDQQQGEESLKLLRALSPRSVRLLADRADREIARRRMGRPIQFSVSETSDTNDQLARHGLITLSEPTAEGTRWGELTDRGREAARLIIGRSPIPEWLSESMKE